MTQPTPADLSALVSDLADLLAYHARDAKDERVQAVLCRAFDCNAWHPKAREAAELMFEIVDRRRLRDTLEGKRPTVRRTREEHRS